MPRDSSGSYTLPVGNPVVDGTVIQSSWANSTLADIAAQLNNVITRDGLLGPTVPLTFPDGTVFTPGISFSAQTNLGITRTGTSSMAFVGGGQTLLALSPTGITFPSTVVYSAPPVFPTGQGDIIKAGGFAASRVYGPTPGGLAFMFGDGSSLSGWGIQQGGNSKVVLYQDGYKLLDIGGTGGCQFYSGVAVQSYLVSSGTLNVAGAVTFSNPLTVANGGTGATTAGNARTNLGAVGLADSNTWTNCNVCQGISLGTSNIMYLNAAQGNVFWANNINGTVGVTCTNLSAGQVLTLMIRAGSSGITGFTTSPSSFFPTGSPRTANYNQWLLVSLVVDSTGSVLLGSTSVVG